jgi:hypothetical protein
MDDDQNTPSEPSDDVTTPPPVNLSDFAPISIEPVSPGPEVSTPADMPPTALESGQATSQARFC